MWDRKNTYPTFNNTGGKKTLYFLVILKKSAFDLSWVYTERDDGCCWWWWWLLPFPLFHNSSQSWQARFSFSREEWLIFIALTSPLLLTSSQRQIIESGSSLRSVSSLSLCKFSVTVITLSECFLSGWWASAWRRVIPDLNYCVFGLLFANLLLFPSVKNLHLLLSVI